MTSLTNLRPRPLHLALLAAFGLAAACSPGDGTSAHPATDDVDHAVRCDPRPDGAMRAETTVTNHSSKESSYFVDVTFSVDGNDIRTNTAIVENVEPGATMELATSLADAPKGATCEIADVTRLKA